MRLLGPIAIAALLSAPGRATDLQSMNQWLRVPPVGLLESPVLSPSILEVDLVNTKAPDPARPASWDFVNTNYLLQLPTPVEFAATVDGHAAGAQQGYFQLRVVLAEQVKIVPSFSPRSKTLTLTWNTVPGNFYRVMSKANLGDTNWTDLSGLLTATTVFNSSTDSLAASAPQWFYAVRVEAIDRVRIASMLPIRGGAKVLTWTSFPGDSYQVVYKNSLSDPNWTDLSGAITASSLTTSWTDYLAAETPRRFYAERTN